MIILFGVRVGGSRLNASPRGEFNPFTIHSTFAISLTQFNFAHTCTQIQTCFPIIQIQHADWLIAQGRSPWEGYLRPGARNPVPVCPRGRAGRGSRRWGPSSVGGASRAGAAAAGPPGSRRPPWVTGRAGTVTQIWWDCGTSPAPDGPSGVRGEVNAQREGRERWRINNMGGDPGMG